jgi:DNA-binding SARP family transcriptional activator
MSVHLGRVATSVDEARTNSVSIAVLGPQIILKDGEEIHPPAPQQRRVLSVLASRPGEVIAREVISHHIWRSATAQQLRSLQSYVSHLRTILGAQTIELVGGGYRLNLEPDCIDEVQFRRHVDAGLADSGGGHFREARRHLEAALALYRGLPFDDLPNGDFAVRRTGLLQLRDAAEDALLRMRVDLIRDAQDCDGLVPLLAQAYADHPDRELRALLYARTLAMAGRLTEAGEVYRSFRSHLKTQTGAEPSTEFNDMMGRLARRDRSAMSLAWDSAVDVPLHMGPIVGRDVEVNAVVTMLEVGGSSLVTIAGPSGVGKTRVAAAVARTVVDDLPGRVRRGGPRLRRP